MRRVALKSDLQEVVVIAPCQRNHGGGDFLLPVSTGADYEGSAMFKIPGSVALGSVTAAAREPAKVVDLQVKGGRQLQIGFESEYLALAARLTDQPVQRQFARRKVNDNPGAIETAVSKAQRDFELRAGNPADTGHLAFPGQCAFEPAKYLQRAAPVMTHREPVPRCAKHHCSQKPDCR